MQRLTIIDQVSGGRIDDPAHLSAVFEAHNANVRATIAPDRLLVFDVADGWEPLCAFLGVAVPDVAFPFTNTPEEFHSNLWVRTPRDQRKA